MSEAERRMALVATRHYLDGLSRIEIADEIGISRFAVARLLEQARERGIVRFEIASPDDLDLGLSAQLREAFRLRHAIVVHAPSGAEDTLKQRLGAAAARLVEEVMTPGEVLGLAAGRTLRQMVMAFDALPPVDVVQLEGVAAGLQESGVELVRHAARVSGGTPHALLAPLLTRSDETAALLRDEPAARETFARFAEVTTAVVGIGSWNPEDSQVSMLAGQLGIRESLLDAGVRADLGAVLLDIDGAVVENAVGRSVGIDAAALRGVPHVLAVAGGPLKFVAVRAALRSGLIHSLACDAGTAQALLADASRTDPHRRSDT
ncbi:sugar-binding transcriptional regulator [Leucobacter chromiiresistens]|uniref:Sugar-binding domain-containing protein n=1 Tax=Leucobacter chromiiresistens TaxID=1079994 RepID=A0A147EH29_9MICO|nr:sugar-binding domain-containing protein [Leucobacter chromiiresistens]KTR83678.1 hypothetical protein NS354_10300 [Leucobacter chromiiresistens]